ncbi:MAG TPA: GNAT family N-acetyltransferase, partial [Chthoniobacterales bacterium]|nr:GNAT family N-acetyltransferase [Chthoniobacterales bacterium]
MTAHPVSIVKVRSRAERDEFIKFAWRIYKNDPSWVPPLIIERRAFLDRKTHPFYQHGDAALFLARRNGQVVGRVMASDDPNYNALHRTNVGCFGLFESIDDVDVAAALFRAVESWLVAKGRNEIMGPIDYSTNYVCGLLIDGFQHPPTVLTAHNPTYYRRLIELCGFEKIKDWYAWWFVPALEPLQRLHRIANARARKHVVKVRQIDLRRLTHESRRLSAVFNEAWKNNWGFVPFTEPEAEHMAKEMRRLIDPRMTLIAEIDDAPVAFVICVPDINVALRRINGRLTRFALPIGLLQLLYYRRRIRTARFVALGVLEKYRRAGIAEMLVLRVMEEGAKRGFTAELSMTLEDNYMVNRFIEALGARKYKTYR